ncbi:MAG TPA: ArsA family ATPase [Chloroflexota bacterium]|nr:ArsA family ATPase [Chloroflexota bacterium]
MSRIILYTGKGGVGKTSVAAATALRCSRRGERTLVLSTDAAHSLGDSLDTPLGPVSAEVAAGLWAQETDVYDSIDRYWGTIQEWIQSVFAWEGIDTVMAEEMAVIPGMDELASLLWILEHHQSGRFDTIVVDCAPTAETFRLLSLPESGRWWLEKIFPVSRRMSGLARPVLRRFTDLPMPDDQVFSAVENLFERMKRVQTLLTDPTIASVRLVINAEKMVIKEAQRAYTYLGLYGYPIDLVICNRLMSEDAAGGYFATFREGQRKYLALAEATFAPVPIRGVPFFDREVVGLPMLERVGDALFEAEDPAGFFYQGKTFTIQKQDERYVLETPVPLADRRDLSLLEAGEELVITVGRYRRNLLLPRVLVGRPVAGAKLESGRLRIEFGGNSHGRV